jgi:hypothetical protein|tara:strand:- start:183 stop:434 length:252 start_codon:yes stop_codon:yes gene_type:complete
MAGSPEGDGSQKSQILLLILSATSTLVLLMAMWILNDIDNRVETLSLQFNSHEKLHPDKKLSNRITVLETLHRIKGAPLERGE